MMSLEVDMYPFRRLSSSTWNDGTFSGLTPTQKLSWLYVLTNEYASDTGVYRLPPERLSAAVYGSRNRQSALELLWQCECRGLLSYDPDQELIWIPNWPRYNLARKRKVAKEYLAKLRHVDHMFARAAELVFTPIAADFGMMERGLSSEAVTLILGGFTCHFCGADLGEDLRIIRLKDDVVAACPYCAAGEYPAAVGRPSGAASREAFRALLQHPRLRERYVEIIGFLPGQIWTDNRVIRFVNELYDTFCNTALSKSVFKNAMSIAPSARIFIKPFFLQRFEHSNDVSQSGNVTQHRKESETVSKKRPCNKGGMANSRDAKNNDRTQHLYFPNIQYQEKKELLLRNTEQLKPTAIAGLLFDLLIDKPGLKSPSSRDELIAAVAKAMYKFPVEMLVEAFGAWEGIPRSLFGALTSYSKRWTATREATNSARFKEARGLVSAEQIDKLLDQMEAQ